MNDIIKPKLRAVEDPRDNNTLRFEEDRDKNLKLQEYLAENSQSKGDPIFIPTEGQYSPKGLMKVISYLFKLILIFIIGGIGGVWLEHNVVPRLATMQPFDKYEFFKEIKDKTLIIKQPEEIKISDDTASLDVVRKTNPAIVKITANYVFQEKPPAVKKRGVAPVLKTKVETRNLVGVIVTSDGMVLTRDPQVFSNEAATKYDLTEVNYNVNYKEKNFSVSGSQNIVSYDSINKSSPASWLSGIVLLKVKANNLPVIALGDASTSEVGEKVIAMGNNIFSGIISEIRRDPISQADGSATVGIISVDNDLDQNYYGSGPLVDLKGDLLGINIIDSQGKITNSFIVIDDFKSFINQVIGR